MRIKIHPKTHAITYIGVQHQYRNLESIPDGERSEALSVLLLNDVSRETILKLDYAVGYTPMDRCLSATENWEYSQGT